MNYRMSTELGLTGACARSRVILNVGDVASDPRYIAASPSCRSEMCVPLIARGDLLGVLTVQNEGGVPALAGFAQGILGLVVARDQPRQPLAAEAAQDLAHLVASAAYQPGDLGDRPPFVCQ